MSVEMAPAVACCLTDEIKAKANRPCRVAAPGARGPCVEGSRLRLMEGVLRDRVSNDQNSIVSAARFRRDQTTSRVNNC